tara:strand:- start:2581 stop:4146 length:1566 start_codon:yes stop_codon:yes gene_type:complete
LGLESDGNLTYNPSSGTLTATAFAGALTGNVTGNASGTAATVTGAAQSNITSLGTLTGLNIGNDAAANLVFTPSSNDTITLASAANGAFTITTVDTAAAAANVGFVVDGNFTVSNVTSTITSSSSDITTFATTNSTSGYAEFAYNTSTVAGYIGNGSSLLSGAANTDFVMRSESGALKFTTGGGNLALTLDASQDATFAGDIELAGKIRADNGSSQGQIILATSKALGSLVAGNTIGELVFQHDLTTADGAVIAAVADEATAAGEQHHGARLEFYTAANGDNTSNPVKNLSIESDGVLISSKGIEFEGSGLSTSQSGISSSGNGGSIRIFTNGNQAFTFGADGSGGDLTIADGDLVIGTAGHGINFSAESPSGSGSASALLDDYEEGSWTPALAVTSGSLTVTLDGTTNAKYVKIGKQVTCWFYILTDVFTPNTASALVQIDGQPFASEDFHVGGSVYYAANGFAGQTPSSIAYATTTRVYLIYRDTADDHSRETRADDFTSGSNADQHQFWGMFHYTAAT